MKKLLLFLILLQIQVPVFSTTVDLDKIELNAGEAVVTRGQGYYMDGRGQVPEYARIAPPHEENIPTPKPTKTVLGWSRYYDINKEGYRPMGYQAPLVPNYNITFSTRRVEPYSKSDYVKVWCAGEPDLKRGTCATKSRVYYFYDVRNWAWAVAATPFRDLKRTKDGRQRSYVFWMGELGLDAANMHAVKEWAELYDVDIHFVTIDSYIPLDFLL